MTATESLTSATARQRRRRRAEQAFLPGALEILETPPAPLAPIMIGLICLFFVVAFGWSWLGKIDVIAIAQGKVQPTGRVKTIQSLRAGRVLEHPADNGSLVHRGDVLLRLDPREALSERDAATAALVAFEAEVARRATALTYARSDMIASVPPIAVPLAIPRGVAEREQRILVADVASLTARVRRLDGEAIQKSAERQKLIDTIAAQRTLVGILQERVTMRQTLVDRNAGTRADLLDGLEDMATQRATLAQELGQVAEAQANLEVIARSRREAIETFIAENAQKLGDAERQVAELHQRVARAEVELDQMAVKSPIDGIVQFSTLTTLGQVVTSGEELMRIVPADATLEVECYLPNQDIGFVKAGQTAVLKIESFPFTRYGTIEADVIRVGEDAIPEPDANQTEEDLARVRRYGERSGADRVQNLVFPVTLRPRHFYLDIDGVKTSIRAGMAVTVEIKTAQRRIIDYILSPIHRTESEALKER